MVEKSLEENVLASAKEAYRDPVEQVPMVFMSSG